MANINWDGKVTDQTGAPKIGLTVELWTAAAYESPGVRTASDTTNSNGLWGFASQDEDIDWIVAVLEGTSKYIIDGRNSIQLKEIFITNALRIKDAKDISFGNGVDAVVRWSTGDSSNHSLVIGLGDSNQGLHITDKGAVATDWNISATTHPNVYIHSNTTPATDYLRLGGHDGTTAYMDVAGGTTLALQIAGTSELTLTATLLSPVSDGTTDLGTTTVGFNDVHLSSGSIINFDGGDITLTHSAGVLTYGGDGAVVLTYGANVDLAFTGASGTNDIVLTDGLSDALSVTDGSADILVIDTSTAGNVATWTVAPTFSGLITANGGITFAAGDDIAFTGASGTNDITLTDGLADALSITRGGTDMIVFDSSTPLITFTPGIVGTTIDATTDFTIGATVITDGVLTDAGGFQMAAVLDMNANAINNVGDAGNDWDANSIKLINANTNGDNLIKLENTATSGTSSATMVVKVDEGSSRNPVYMLSVEASGGDSNFLIALDNDASDRFSISASNTVGTNDGFRMSNATPPVITYNTSHPTGYWTPDYVCGNCGKTGTEMFECCGVVEWHDDVMDYRAMALRDPDALDYMERVGVIERGVDNDGKPEIFNILGRDFDFAMSAAFQNRQRMDAQHQAMDERLARIEASIGV